MTDIYAVPPTCEAGLDPIEFTATTFTKTYFPISIENGSACKVVNGTAQLVDCMTIWSFSPSQLIKSKLNDS
jgi:hypothetical protein